jgi:arylsulfatase A-like enzyme
MKSQRFSVLILFTLSSLFASAAQQPNIIYINADDLGIMDVSYNSDRYITPNIDKLASAGMTFVNGYAAAANCAPSRACVMSGQWGPRHGVYTVSNSDRGSNQHRRIIPIKNTLHLDDEMLTLPEVLQAGGYKTIHLGKWHLGEDPTTQGFDVNIGGDTSGGPSGGYYTPVSKGPMLKYNDPYPDGTHLTEIFSDQATKFIRANKDEPFFMHMAYYSVHTKLIPVREFIDYYKDKDVHATYASMVQKMDESIGRIMDELDRLGLAENTLVVFSSDNGGICEVSHQTPYRAGKGSYFEGGIRVPYVMRWPNKIAPGSICETPVTGLDFFPTFLDVAELAVPESKALDGNSILPLMTNQGDFPERSLFWHFPIYLQKYNGVGDDSHDPLFRTRPGAVVVKGDWKLHEYFEDGRLELYNIIDDIGERNNLASSMPEKVQELHKIMLYWRARTAAPVPTEKNPLFDPKEENKAIQEQVNKSNKGKAE